MNSDKEHKKHSKDIADEKYSDYKEFDEIIKDNLFEIYEISKGKSLTKESELIVECQKGNLRGWLSFLDRKSWEANHPKEQYSFLDKEVKNNYDFKFKTSLKNTVYVLKQPLKFWIE